MVEPKVNIKRARLAEQILGRWDEQQTIAEIARGLECGQNTVRRALDNLRPGERLARSSSPKPSQRPCTGCGEIMQDGAFPERHDRPGRRHSRCLPCLRDWRRAWQTSNPERNREGVRRRRARLRQSRAESYRDRDVYTRDHGVCWFCNIQIDPLLKYPDPRAMVIHHIHPISKMGPDIFKNVAIAHYDCNHRAKASYSAPFKSWVVAPIPIPEARAAVISHHYLHRSCPMSYPFGLYDESDRLRGVIALGTPSSIRVTRSITDAEVKVLELKRLWIDDDAPFGVGSYFVSRALNQTPPALIVSYADTEVSDPRYGSSHDGAIYRACSFNYAGTSRPNTEWRMPGQSRNVGKHQEGSVQTHVSPKARYWTATGSAKQRKALRRVSKWSNFPYVKMQLPE